MNNGYTHRFGKTVGGIKKIALTPVCNIKSTTSDPSSGCYSSILLHDQANLAECSFAENAAAYREETDIRNGIPFVVHSLEFHTDKIDQESDRLIRQIASASYCGLAAIITTNENIRLIVGYSDEHLAERPLRLEKIFSDSGKKHTDGGYEAISLISRDTAKARILTGTIG